MATSLDRFRRTAERSRRLEAELEKAREDFYEALAAARAEWHSLAELARTLGVTRQRVKQILQRSQGP